MHLLGSDRATWPDLGRRVVESRGGPIYFVLSSSRLTPWAQCEDT